MKCKHYTNNYKKTPRNSRTVLAFKADNSCLSLTRANNSFWYSINIVIAILWKIFQKKNYFQIACILSAPPNFGLHRVLYLKQALHNSLHAGTAKECGKWLISMHSSISWQHCLINAKLKLCATIKCMAELQKTSIPARPAPRGGDKESPHLLC